MKKKIWLICLIAVIIALIYSGWRVVSTLSENGKNDDCYEDIRNECFIDESEDTPKKTESKSENNTSVATRKKVNFVKLKKKAEKAIGWIYSPNTQINYPIMQHSNNSYYLNHLSNGNRNAGGAIFADYQNEPDFSDYNTVIYGHHMRNHSMFGSLTNYKDQSYYNKHKVMYLYTDKGDYKLKLICGFTTKGTSDLYLVPANAKLTKKLINYGISHSTFKSKVKIKDGDRIVTLSTCSQSEHGDRYVVMAKLVAE